MEIRAIHQNEISVLSDLQPDGWADIVPHFNFYTQSSFCVPVKVVVDKKIVGIGVSIVHHDVAWLAHIIVRPEERCKGWGRLITQALMDVAKQQHCSTIYMIATKLGFPVYEKLGFLIETEYIFCRRVGESPDLSVSDHVQPYQEQYKEHISAMDKNISGEDRMMHLEARLAKGFVHCDRGMVHGYYLPSLGEGLIVADTGHAGLELLKWHLRHSSQIVVPEENMVARTFLQALGFEEASTAKRMRLGNIRSVKFSNIYNRIGGNIG